MFDDQIQLLGAGAFGILIGWYVYYINRYRKGDIQFSDLVTLIGVLGGAAILALFPAKTSLFGAYGVGLAIGFFLYFMVLNILVAVSPNFNVDWFLDGRRMQAVPPWVIPGEIRPSVAAMDPRHPVAAPSAASAPPPAAGDPPPAG
jgi:hypothetical protein